jgi:hypothetical protein
MHLGTNVLVEPVENPLYVIPTRICYFVAYDDPRGRQ